MPLVTKSWHHNDSWFSMGTLNREADTYSALLSYFTSFNASHNGMTIFSVSLHGHMHNKPCRSIVSYRSFLHMKNDPTPPQLIPNCLSIHASISCGFIPHDAMWVSITDATPLFMHLIDIFSQYRDHFLYAPSQWEATLQCNIVSHWLCAYRK